MSNENFVQVRRMKEYLPYYLHVLKYYYKDLRNTVRQYEPQLATEVTCQVHLCIQKVLAILGGEILSITNEKSYTKQSQI